MPLVWPELTVRHHLPRLSFLARRSPSRGSSATVPRDERVRNPSRLARQLIIGSAFAIPGAVAGLLLGLFPHPVVNAALALIGALIGLAIGAWIERT
jgi:hypothetical protein